MNAVRETILALFLAGWIMLIALRVNTNTSIHLYNTQKNVANQENLNLLSRVIEYDFRKIGHGLINPYGAIQLADSNRIIFSYDKNPLKVYDSIKVEYRLINVKQRKNEQRLLRIENRRKRTLFPFKIARFSLKYYNKFGKRFPTPVVRDSLKSIREIEILIGLEVKDASAKKYGKAFYKTRIVPKNLLSHYE